MCCARDSRLVINATISTLLRDRIFWFLPRLILPLIFTETSVYRSNREKRLEKKRMFRTSWSDQIKMKRAYLDYDRSSDRTWCRWWPFPLSRWQSGAPLSPWKLTNAGQKRRDPWAESKMRLQWKTKDWGEEKEQGNGI